MTHLKQAIDDYLAYCEPKKLNVKSIKAYTIDLEQLVRYTVSESIPVKADKPAYIAHLHKTYLPQTVKRKIASIRPAKHRDN
jgi:site-specific recombinase XerD